MSKFECKYCRKTFEREKAYLKHECKKMKRIKAHRTPLGQQAYNLYKKWLTFQGKTAPPPETFITSRFYNSFMRIAEFVKKTKLASVDIFIKVMVEKTYEPVLWLRDDVYTFYLTYMQTQVSPLKQADISVMWLYKIADAAEVDVSEVFTVLSDTELLSLIRQQKISPWILFSSKEFEKRMRNTSDVYRSHYMALLRPDYWKRRFKKDPKTKELMREITQAMGI